MTFMNDDADQKLETLVSIIRERKTTKVLAETAQGVSYQKDQLRRSDDIVTAALLESGCAPFHYDRNVDGIAEPWRIYWLNNDSCRWLARHISQLIPDLKPNSKLPGLLSGCGSLAIFNWIPQTEGDARKLQRINDEHLAATAAAVQNFLLQLTAAGLENYWSSGGLWEQSLYKTLGIRDDQRTIGVVFVHYPEGQGKTTCIGGKQRQRRSSDQQWLKYLNCPSQLKP